MLKESDNLNDKNLSHTTSELTPSLEALKERDTIKEDIFPSVPSHPPYSSSSEASIKERDSITEIPVSANIKKDQESTLENLNDDSGKK